MSGSGLDLVGLIDDLQAEHRTLRATLHDAGWEVWELPTRAAPWRIREQVAHLTFFDEVAMWSIDHPERLDTLRAAFDASIDPSERADVVWARELAPQTLWERWCRANDTLVTRLARLVDEDPGRRLDWIGPSMGLASFVSARLMETWAHGVDVVNALGHDVADTVSDRLRHVCFLGWAARRFALATHGITDLDDPLRLEAIGPSGELWAWGPEDAPNRVRGSALEIALVVTQRRHVSRTSVEATGALARRWLEVAQAFAGPPTVASKER
ncbi:conserved hypothetical protein [Acidimicrobium ferrooxidans DSM 10331]|uniref:Mycothiol-dependent maleylpyruvate isomerase metal-binding domain-containing protein n=1 Tax=Acidimicrobium ferrooxidans (strain DSM 10331 / JCM 15462 / NBRC 103882 / ICP) TaxID=525909 RepID=C7LZ10_ACIFD|nr:TIGR03084 family metal-binding protein [Acidimicrobium ferrooxidans]ACU53968.1 conserved hypothetical protein [Acidimicrobium ferrooxidans DSM 10331]